MKLQNHQHLRAQANGTDGATRRFGQGEEFARHFVAQTRTPGGDPGTFDVVHIDYARLTTNVLSEAAGGLLVMPWLVIAMSADQTGLLGWMLCRRKPDGSTIVALTKQVTRRHRQAPLSLTIANGSVHRSDLLDRFCAAHGIDQCRSSPVGPLGTPAERTFRMVRRQVCEALCAASEKTDPGYSLTVAPCSMQQLKRVLARYFKSAFPKGLAPNRGPEVAPQIAV